MIFNDWIVSFRLKQRRMLGVIFMESFKSRQQMNVAGSIVGFNEKTVIRHRNDFFKNKGHLSESRRGSTRDTVSATTMKI